MHKQHTSPTCPPETARHIIMIDIENINGGPINTLQEATWCIRTIKENLKPKHDEIVIIATTTWQGLFHAKTAWPAARVLYREGSDGADLKLIDVLNDENLTNRFTHIDLVSGDGIFANHIAPITAAGLTVTSYAWATCFSARLKLASTHTVHLDNRIAAVHQLTKAA